MLAYYFKYTTPHFFEDKVEAIVFSLRFFAADRFGRVVLLLGDPLEPAQPSAQYGSRRPLQQLGRSGLPPQPH